MRPRVFPAEDLPIPLRSSTVQTASMRPRVFPAEDRPADARHAARIRASMRPRVFPAEDTRRRGSPEHRPAALQ